MTTKIVWKVTHKFSSLMLNLGALTLALDIFAHFIVQPNTLIAFVHRGTFPLFHFLNIRHSARVSDIYSIGYNQGQTCWWQPLNNRWFFQAGSLTLFDALFFFHFLFCFFLLALTSKSTWVFCLTLISLSENMVDNPHSCIQCWTRDRTIVGEIIQHNHNCKWEKRKISRANFESKRQHWWMNK
jgi:hypothetical protein